MTLQTSKIFFWQRVKKRVSHAFSRQKLMPPLSGSLWHRCRTCWPGWGFFMLDAEIITNNYLFVVQNSGCLAKHFRQILKLFFFQETFVVLADCYMQQAYCIYTYSCFELGRVDMK